MTLPRPRGDASRAPAWARLRAALLVATLSVAGCTATEQVDESEPDPFAGLHFEGGTPFATQSLGSLLTDRFTLPLVAPDGHSVAYVIGETPDWSARLGLPGAKPPTESAVAVDVVSPDSRPARIAIVDDVVTLGRSATLEGFLVEAPREDGSRDVGLVDWIDGSIEWLLDDGAVHAMATIGPRGGFAWCRRMPDSLAFDLVIRAAGGDVVIAAPTDGTWLLPTFSSDESRVFAFSLRGGTLRLASIRVIPGGKPIVVELESIATGATPVTAYQTINAIDGAIPGPGQPGEAFVFYHPRDRRAALWLDDERRMVLFPNGSLAATFVGPESVLVGLRGGVVRQSIVPNVPAQRLLDRLALPRPLKSETFDAILILPSLNGVDLLGIGSTPGS